MTYKQALAIVDKKGVQLNCGSHRRGEWNATLFDRKQNIRVRGFGKSLDDAIIDCATKYQALSE